jgi:hypothetical protein
MIKNYSEVEKNEVCVRCAGKVVKRDWIMRSNHYLDASPADEGYCIMHWQSRHRLRGGTIQAGLCKKRYLKFQCQYF